jgi:hypothetical protein
LGRYGLEPNAKGKPQLRIEARHGQPASPNAKHCYIVVRSSNWRPVTKLSFNGAAPIRPKILPRQDGQAALLSWTRLHWEGVVAQGGGCEDAASDSMTLLQWDGQEA